MLLRIQLFAGLAERLQTSVLSYSVPKSEMTADELKIALSISYPEAASQISVSFVAVNQEYAPGDYLITENAEIALIPPVSGGDGQASVHVLSKDGRYCITDQPLSVDDVTSKVLDPNHGAILSFVGTTREMTGEQRTVHLEYEAYIPMALSQLEAIGKDIDTRWPGTLCAISHRIGKVDIMETSVIIAISTGHRDDSYEASRYAIEKLKQSVPIWKKEIWDDGSEWKGHQKGPWDPTVRL
ncbi:molybdenum cofactor biosynthesis protein MoaE [Paenibacillus dokdonensis]|uniref:Molybdenum cofactor biosynthesis protein MoaE n=1 Tax=Paenibacillus dokdonensis TaxID=2567944 RepID=A0ABU6GHA6_9BACL|nr:molybdenum cofactor biosynthesis protein MoaE [Paenibacillus dokdonensis]MEC0238754.1 molybdenum cofactor biosynthesis protein MoaE [Paenibacillus dokdonensis]